MRPYASCNYCCIVHSTSAGADHELLGSGSICMLLLHLAQTCAILVLTFAPCACGDCHWQQLTVMVLLSQLLTQILLLHTWRIHPLQLAPVVFLLPWAGGLLGAWPLTAVDGVPFVTQAKPRGCGGRWLKTFGDNCGVLAGATVVHRCL